MTVGLVPVARAEVQRRNEFRRLILQVQAQYIGEEVVITVPLTPVVERDQKEVSALQGFQDGFAVVSPVTASHNGARNRSRTEVRMRNVLTSSG